MGAAHGIMLDMKIDASPQAHSQPLVRSRDAQRAALLKLREEIAQSLRDAWNARITAAIQSEFPSLAAMTIAFCWPIKGEFDARDVIEYFRMRGAVAALPRVTDRATPLRFHQWWPDAPMILDSYQIPAPNGTAALLPDAVLIPMVGFDARGYRLGYGGGLFDRTLAACDPRPLAIGIAYELGRVATIEPRPHDIPMDFIVTEAGVHVVSDRGLQRTDGAELRAQIKRLCEARGLPRVHHGQAQSYASPPCYAHEFSDAFAPEQESGSLEGGPAEPAPKAK